MNEYHVPKSRVAVTISLTDGSRVAGAMFVRQRASDTVDPDDIMEVLNSVDRFFPLEVPSGDVVLISKSGVVDLTSREGACVLPTEPGFRMREIEIAVATGSVKRGQVCYSPPADKTRLKDYLNDLSSPFIYILANCGVCFVSRGRITSVREIRKAKALARTNGARGFAVEAIPT
jgi:hypothetical protein